MRGVYCEFHRTQFYRILTLFASIINKKMRDIGMGWGAGLCNTFKPYKIVCLFLFPNKIYNNKN